jgi:putative transposase
MVLELVAAAVEGGAKQASACAAVGVDERTLQRWQCPERSADGRHGPTTVPANKLSLLEREAILQAAESSEFQDKSPRQIVPLLADRGEYIGSESSFYRVMKIAKLLMHRGRSKPKTAQRPKALSATEPNQVYTWDITYLLSRVRGIYFYLYLFLDIFSRKIVGFRVHDREAMELSAPLLAEICEREHIIDGQLTVHADNGGSMKGATMLATMEKLGVEKSFSRPSVSDDNAFSESLFKTLKYCSIFPTKPFESVEAAQAWVVTFVQWYNEIHLHSAIGFVTPSSRHSGLDVEILKQREIVYAEAKRRNPNRWSNKTRNWERVATVNLNCLNEKEMRATATAVA